MKYSYEGEGPNLGHKTLFFKYKKDDLPYFYSKSLEGINFVYINSDIITEELITWCNDWMFIDCLHNNLTIELDISLYSEGLRRTLDSSILLFCNANSYTKIENYINTFIKVRVFSEEEFNFKLDMSNKYAKDGHNVLLMPEYSYDTVGKLMMKYFNQVHPRVRFMPPIQNIIKID